MYGTYTVQNLLADNFWLQAGIWFTTCKLICHHRLHLVDFAVKIALDIDRIDRISDDNPLPDARKGCSTVFCLQSSALNNFKQFFNGILANIAPNVNGFGLPSGAGKRADGRVPAIRRKHISAFLPVVINQGDVSHFKVSAGNPRCQPEQPTQMCISGIAGTLQASRQTCSSGITTSI
ncbi:hypothetical protein B0H10DRAFT_1968086 [Mycena sp. CBHHK59/15]|nr:hypothetical protein B0H10DRAFT_1968086 [Mycena sp. CBHHK59/15]